MRVLRALWGWLVQPFVRLGSHARGLQVTFWWRWRFSRPEDWPPLWRDPIIRRMDVGCLEISWWTPTMAQRITDTLMRPLPWEDETDTELRRKLQERSRTH